MSTMKKLPIGIEHFEEMITEDFYYVDKTGLIRELLDKWGKVNLFTRPRRFGKSLNMNMLQCFFEIGCNRQLFAGLEISKDVSLCEAYMGKFPVISISLKGVSGSDYEKAEGMVREIICMEAHRHQYLLDSDKLSVYDKQALKSLLMKETDGGVLENAILQLSRLLRKHYDNRVIILIDEYDVPLAKAYSNGYYDQMVDLIRGILEQALKTNESLHFAVLTGCLRVSKESIFTGLNNVNVFSIVNVQFDEFFGFTDREVREILSYYGLSDKYDRMKEWYDGYQFGDMEVYCPWDVIHYVRDLREQPEAEPEAYWLNTSSNDIVRKLLQKANNTTKREIEQLIAGETIKKTVRKELTYKEIDAKVENIWSVLFTTGYLTKRGAVDGDMLSLVIPNEEIRKIFKIQIYEWFQDTAWKDLPKLATFCDAFVKGEAESVEKQFNAYLSKMISIRDTSVRKKMKENFYHGILLGLLSYREDWDISSNTESGEGYSDILIETEDAGVGIVIEVKYAENDKLDKECMEALSQIQEKKYETVLLEHGMQSVIKFGIACYRKHCKVMVERSVKGAC